MTIIGFLVSAAICLFMSIDAPKHGKNPWLWGILGFLFGLLPLGIYLIQTRRTALGIIAVCVYAVFIVISIVVGIISAVSSLN